MAFTWHRGRSGLSQGSSSAAVLFMGTYVNPPGTPTTLRRVIIDWGIDLFNGGLAGTTNGHAPLTIGLTTTTGTSSTNPPTPAGPSEEPNNPWLWWNGSWYDNNYGYTIPAEESGAFSAHGRLDRSVPTDLSSTLYTKFWLVAEVDDITLAWSTLIMIGWWQFLMAPTGS